MVWLVDCHLFASWSLGTRLAPLECVVRPQRTRSPLPACPRLSLHAAPCMPCSCAAPCTLPSPCLPPSLSISRSVCFRPLKRHATSPLPLLPLLCPGVTVYHTSCASVAAGPAITPCWLLAAGPATTASLPDSEIRVRQNGDRIGVEMPAPLSYLHSFHYPHIPSSCSALVSCTRIGAQHRAA